MEAAAPQFGSLPVELWRTIISFMDRADQRTCLFVSRSYHDIAASFVFFRVLIFFGSWYSTDDPIQFSDNVLNETVTLQEQKLHTESVELLEHITDNPRFASMVRQITVAALDAMDDTPDLGYLVDALKLLHNLQVFRYYGQCTDSTSAILDALASGPGRNLTEIRLPCRWRLLPDESSYFLRDHLQKLVIGRMPAEDSTLTPIIPVEVLEQSAKVARRITEANASTLRQIVVPGMDWIPPSSSETFPQPEELELTYLLRVQLDLGHVFSRFASLTSFSMVSAEPEHVTMLGAHPKALPHLTSFNLTSVMSISVRTFADFVLQKPSLRRLIVMTCDEELAILDVLPRLPALEVLGFDIWEKEEWSTEDHRRLDETLPANLSALLIWSSIHHCPVPHEEWATLLQKRARLRYVHTLSEEGHKLDLSDALLAHCPPSLELVGFGAMFRWVVKTAVGDAGAAPSTYSYSEHWPLSKVLFKDSLAFGDEDWEWLLRHHNASLFEPHLVAA